MMSLPFAFWALVLLFAVIGAMRGWAKEMLVTFSVILALFVMNVLGRYIGPARDFLAMTATSEIAFWVHTFILIAMAFFGYQTPNLPRIQGARFARERFSDILLGFMLGAINGYLIVGSLWYFMHVAGYPFPKYITAPPEDLTILSYLPPQLLGIPVIYFAVAIAFIFVLVVFL